MHLRATTSTSFSQNSNVCLPVGGESSFQLGIESLTSLDCPQKALENFFRSPKALARFLTGAGPAFLGDGYCYATLTSYCDCEGCSTGFLSVGASWLRRFVNFYLLVSDTELAF